MQTGLYPTNTGVWKNTLSLEENELTLAKLFNEAGYETGYIGKWHLAGVYTGRDDWKEEPVPREKRGGYRFWLGAELPEFTSDAYHPLLFDESNKPVKLPGYRVDAYTDEAIKFISRNRNNPFMLFLSIFEPHHQNNIDAFVAPRGYAERYSGRWIPPRSEGRSLRTG